MAGGEAEDSRKRRTKADSYFQSASLKFSVGGIQGHLKSLTCTHGCVGTQAAVHNTAHPELTTALSGNVPNDLKVMSISVCLTTCYLWK